MLKIVLDQERKERTVISIWIKRGDLREVNPPYLFLTWKTLKRVLKVKLDA